MSDVSPIGPSYTIPIAFASGSAGLTVKDSLSLYEFLKLQTTTTDKNKQGVFDSQAVDSVVNRVYFLGIVQALTILAQKYAETLGFTSSLVSLFDNYNSSVDSVNASIDTYNSDKNTLNSQISTMNSAINTINGISNPTAAQIATFNQAVTNYNNYLTSIGNPALLAYANAATNEYNDPTSTANNVTIPAINQTIIDLNLGIPLVPPFDPTSAPVGASPQAPQSNYSGVQIPLIPGNYPSLPHLNRNNLAVTPQDIVNTFFLPYAEDYLAALKAVSKKLAGIDEYRAFVNFIQKQGFLLNPAKVDAFILNTAKPSLPEGGSASGGTLGSLIVGLDSINLERILSTALFKAVIGADNIPIPPHIYDEINLLALTLQERIGAAAGLSVIKLLGETLKSLPTDSKSILVALAATILQNILKIVADGKATREALVKILGGVPEISQAQKEQLADQLVAAQNLSLLNNAALSTSLLLQLPTLTPDILNTSSFSTTTTITTPTGTATSTTTVISDEESPIPEDPYSPNTVNGVLGNPQSSYQVSQQLSDRLASDAKFPKPTTTPTVINQALQNTAKALPPNATPAQFQTTLTEQLLKQNVRVEEAQFLAENARALVDSIRGQLKTEALAKQISEKITALVKSDVVNPLPESVAASIISSLTDIQNPNSFASLYLNQIQTLNKNNDKKIANEIVLQRREFEKPQIDVFVTLQRILNPANNIILSFMTGVMYDKTIPTNWQKPLQIQV